MDRTRCTDHYTVTLFFSDSKDLKELLVDLLTHIASDR